MKELQDVTDETNAVDSMAKMETALASLGDLYDQVVKKPKDADENFLFGYADPDTLNNVEQGFKDFIETLEDDSKTEILSHALKDFETTLLEFPNNEEKAQAAMDKLMTAYIDQAYNLENLTEENKEWTIALLKNKGVVNAEAVVESRLDKMNKKILASEKQLSNVFRDNAKALDEVNRGTGEWNEALASLADAINTMFTIEGEDGFVFTPDIDTSFIVQHLDLIRQAASGDVEAIDQLRAAVMDDIVARVDIEGADPAQINSIKNTIRSMISSANNELDDIEIGTYLDDAPFNKGINNMIQGLNYFVKAGTMTADEMNKILASIGVDPVVDGYEEVEMSIDEAIAGGNLGHDAAIAAKGAGRTTITLMMPKIRYKKSADTFKTDLVGANYSKPPSSDKSKGSGSGSGGSNNDKLNEDTEETFDWIEVKIQRVQEEINRLDKVVGNVYENWIDRNESLDGELEKTAELMRVHEHAYNRYLANAKEVKVENAPKKEDYGDDDKQYQYDLGQYNEAVERWKTGEYQKKIEQGFLGDGDIEKIKNKYLVEVINSYKEIYQKAVDAKDAIKDDQIKLGELNRTNFDHIKSEFEELIGYITRAGDHIDEQISRTEEHGYFVSKKYYKDQLALEQQHRAQLEQEYARLQQAQIDAVNSGAIQAGSEAYNQMSEEIDGVR